MEAGMLKDWKNVCVGHLCPSDKARISCLEILRGDKINTESPIVVCLRRGIG